MKNLFFVFCFLGVLLSCSSDDDDNEVSSELRGVWVISRIETDIPEPIEVNSGKTVEFKNGNVIISNGLVCSPFTDADNPGIGEYTLEIKPDNEFSGKITCPPCDDTFCCDTVSFYIENSELYINYPVGEMYIHVYKKKK